MVLVCGIERAYARAADPVGVILTSFWDPWALLGSPWSRLGRSEGTLERSWGLLEITWGAERVVWNALGRLRESF